MKTFNLNTALLSGFMATILLFSIHILNAQDNKIKNDVIIVTSYQPTISDAYKINSLPKINDTTKVESTFKYTIESKPVSTDFKLEPITAASMLGEPLTKLYSTYIKAGFGNYYMPLFELKYHNLRSKVSSWGVDLGHLSSNSKLKLENGEKVDASWAENDVSFYGKHFVKKQVIGGEVSYNRNSLHNYGYDTRDDSSITNYKNFKQIYSLVGAKGYIKSINTDSSKFNYNTALDYNYLQDVNGFFQHSIIVAPQFNGLYKGNLIGINSDFDFYHKNQTIDTVSDFIFRLNPYVVFKGATWKINLGVNLVGDFYDQESKYNIYPKLDLQYQMIENILLSYAGVNGDLEKNDYKKIISENPYVLPTLNVLSTNNLFNFYAGFKGNFSSKTGFNIRASYGMYKDAYFFVNYLDTDSLLNQFDVVYDNTDLFRFFGEFVTRPSDKLSLSIKGNYYYYTLMEKEKYAWHKPGYDLTLSSKYNLRNKILINADCFFIGKRYAKSYDTSIDKITLKEIVDLNLGIEYRYSKILSFFINFNNIAASKYYKWNNYPSQRFNLIGGFTYSL